MKVVVTGASGNVGQRLVPQLLQAGAEVLVVGRDMNVLKQVFPTLVASTYDDLSINAAGFDALVHLAVANTDTVLSPEEVRYANVEWALEIAHKAQAASICTFINVSSIHALDERNNSPYALSKRECAARLKSVEGMLVLTAYLAAVHDDRYSGKLSVLNALPQSLARLLFHMLASLKPTVHSSAVAAYVLAAVKGRVLQDAILADDQDRNVFFKGAKRAVDLAFSVCVLVFFNWLLLLVWIAVRLESSGPGIFVQDRVGLGGKVFKCYKFRSMRDGTQQVGTHEISAAEVTAVGHILRKTKLDELPQAWNILCNEMSLVGPRPCLPVQAELVGLRMDSGVLGIKPGISGLAQINGIDMSDPARLVSYDLRYKMLRSLLLDLRVMLATATGRGQGDKIANP